MRFLLVILLSISPMIVIGQNSAVSDFKESHETALSLYFYPSTLRMINIDRNPEFDDMIRDIKKARFFKLDSGKIMPQDIAKLEGNLKDEGFENLMMMKSKDLDLRIWGLERKDPEVILFAESLDGYMLLEVSGMINIAKLPKLAETFNQNAFLDVLQLNNNQ